MWEVWEIEMDQAYVIALIPVAAGYLAWLTSRMMKLAETQATTVAKLDMIVVRQDSQHERQEYLTERIDFLAQRR